MRSMNARRWRGVDRLELAAAGAFRVIRVPCARKFQESDCGASHGRPRAARQAGSDAGGDDAGPLPSARLPQSCGCAHARGKRSAARGCAPAGRPRLPPPRASAIRSCAHFDQRIGEAARGRDGVDRVAAQRAVVGLVVADRLGARSASPAERAQQRRRAGADRGPTARPTFHGRAAPRQSGVKEWIERIAGGSPLAQHRFDRRCDRLAIGRPVAARGGARSPPRRPAHCPARSRRRKCASPGSDRRRRGWDRSAAARRSRAPPARRAGRRAGGSARPRRCHRRCGAPAPRAAGRDRHIRAASALAAWSQITSAPASSAPSIALDRDEVALAVCSVLALRASRPLRPLVRSMRRE